ncbi:hypothetical protein CK227_10260 [Mesorhizobium sp. WSM4308]|uniref:hypothetical protein n=1 Tax=Mesorhizobium sp. WSM4308 TaxID=2029409 RepID=UPI000BAF5399|nr:hypothetical protein [Mesorhizobium sp. WSM4308]PBB75166.1 hypothetical protein CK227_10260 [Mesorhizobium sp. WSM4308]
MAGFAIKRPDTAFVYDKSSKATKRIEDPAHLAFIRKLPSVLSGAYGCEACHIRSGSALHRKKHTGGQQKPDDAWTLPLTPDEHKEQHSGAELEFWRSRGIDPFELAIKLYEVTGQIEAAETIIKSARKP